MSLFRHSIFFVVCILLAGSAFGQSLSPMNQVPVIENGKTLRFPFAGGLNQPQFSPIDFDGDGTEDLFVFDRAGQKILTFLNNGSTGQVDYEYAPQYEDGFPELSDWVLIRDYNCDNKPDIFTSTIGKNAISVYKNVSSGGNLEFQLVRTELQNASNNWVIGVSSQDIPALDDLDNDGDLDLLVFDIAGFQTVWYKNLAEVYGCDTLWLEEETACWGEFEEDGLTNTVSLNVSCKGGPASNTLSALSGVHAGSTLCTFDVDGNFVKDVLIGDLNYDNIVFLHNGGTTTSAIMDSTEFFYPPSSPVNLEIFPAAFWIDVNNDGRKDLIAAPNAPNISANFKQVWFYPDLGLGPEVNFVFENTDFLANEMIECGARANPVFYDYNGDGLLDLIIGNFDYKTSATNFYSGLTLYKNTGTATQPEFELITRDFLNLSAMFNPPEAGLAPAFGDLDGDGDHDMVLGTFNGNLHYFQNDGGAGDSSEFNLLIVNMEGIDVGQNAKPQLVDLNRDGLLDLVVGENQGNLNYYQNTGTRSDFEFPAVPDNNMLGDIDVLDGFTGYSAPFVYNNANNDYELFIGCEQGRIFHFDGIDGNLSGTFALQDSVYGALDLGGRSALHAADIDDDGFLEFAIGNDRGGVGLYETDLVATSLDPTDGVDRRFSLEFAEISPNVMELRFGEEPFRTAEISLYDLNGKRCLHRTLNGYQPVARLQNHDLAAGLYIIQVLFDKEESVSKKWSKIQ